MVVNGVLRLNIYRLVVTLNRLLVLLELVIGSSEVAVIGRYSRIDLDGLSCQLHLLFVVTHLPHGLALQVEEVTCLRFG